MDPVFYNSGDSEFKYSLGPQIALNTLNCNGFKLSYTANIIALRVSDQSNFLIKNLATAVNGATT